MSFIAPIHRNPRSRDKPSLNLKIYHCTHPQRGCVKPHTPDVSRSVIALCYFYRCRSRKQLNGIDLPQAYRLDGINTWVHNKTYMDVDNGNGHIWYVYISYLNISTAAVIGYHNKSGNFPEPNNSCFLTRETRIGCNTIIKLYHFMSWVLIFQI